MPVVMLSTPYRTPRSRCSRMLAAALPCVSVVLALLALGEPAAAEAQRHHTVRPGQSLARIARRYQVDVWDLALASDLQPSATLRPGQTLVMPAPHTTYVRPGQTLTE